MNDISFYEDLIIFQRLFNDISTSRLQKNKIPDFGWGFDIIHWKRRAWNFSGSKPISVDSTLFKKILAAAASKRGARGCSAQAWWEEPGLPQDAGAKTGSASDQRPTPGALVGAETVRPGLTKDSGAGIPDEGIRFDAHSPTGCVQYNMVQNKKNHGFFKVILLKSKILFVDTQKKSKKSLLSSKNQI